MTLQEFIDKWNGKGLDYDGAYGFQCMDVYRQYVKDVLGAKQSPPVTGAVNVWDTYLSGVFTRTENTPTNSPKSGDVVIWGTRLGQYGHIAVCTEADANNFTSFDQNYPIGSVCHLQKHTYVGVLGWLRPKGISTPPVIPVETPTDPDKIKIDLGDPWGIMEAQAVRSTLNDMKKTIEDGKVERSGLKTQVDEMIKSRQALAEKLGCADDFAVIMSEIQKLIAKEDQHEAGEAVSSGLIQWFIKLFQKK